MHASTTMTVTQEDHTDRLYANAPLVIFKWVQQHDTVRRLSRLRTDFSYATPRLMRIIYSIYKEFFNADVKIPVPYSLKPTTYEYGAFRAFQPQTFPVMTNELDGLYRSTDEKISDYQPSRPTGNLIGS